MTVTRWKVMAGVLGVSLGGLAAIAGQCPKPGEHKTQRADDKVEAPKVVPPAGAGRSAPNSPLDLPALPSSTSNDPLKLPDVPPPSPTPMTSAPKPVLPPMPTVAAPPSTPVVPVSGTAPTVPTTPVPSTPPVAVTPPSPTPIEFTKPPMTPPAVVTGPEVAAPYVPPASVQPTVQPVANVAPPISQPLSVQTAATKFRIILRVGEGEPMFEVRSGDDLVMKVICEKVDIKSPERGQSLSAVTASGRVRFVGFGSEGTCDTLSFLAGTGEVSMSGNVKIQVKDKLGRVESELSTESIKYRIDTSILPGTLKP